MPPASSDTTNGRKQAFQHALRATNGRFFARLGRRLVGKQRVGQEQLDAFEASLLAADIDLDTTSALLDALAVRVKQQPYLHEEELLAMLADEIQARLPSSDLPPYASPCEGQTHVLLLVGVNGVGKTTTAARLAHGYGARAVSVCMGAADTFRAAAIDQLCRWGERLAVPVVARSMGADPSAVAYDTLQYARTHQTQVAIIDTAGRLHNKKHLMEELSKLHRVMGKAMEGAPHETLLVLDATTGQNAFAQAEAFIAATRVSGIVLTKLDGSAKGGVLLGVAAKYGLPIRYVGLGEGLDDLQSFDAVAYTAALLAAPATS